VGFVVVKMVMGQVFSEYMLQFPVPIFIPTAASLSDELKKKNDWMVERRIIR
jgi:hypothetical protein